jgi:hypothetical protein
MERRCRGAGGDCDLWRRYSGPILFFSQRFMFINYSLKVAGVEERNLGAESS